MTRRTLYALLITCTTPSSVNTCAYNGITPSSGIVQWISDKCIHHGCQSVQASRTKLEEVGALLQPLRLLAQPGHHSLSPRPPGWVGCRGG